MLGTEDVLSETDRPRNRNILQKVKNNQHRNRNQKKCNSRIRNKVENNNDLNFIFTRKSSNRYCLELKEKSKYRKRCGIFTVGN